VILLRNFRNIFLVPELVRRLLVTFGILMIYRIGTFIPVIGINVNLIAKHMSRVKGLGGLLSYLDTFSGGALESATIFALGIGPYITASIMMQMLTMAVPSLEQLSKEGDYGRRIINQYTRYVAVFLSIAYSSGYIAYLESNGLVLNPGIGFRFMFILSLTVGSVFVMWLGDQISLMGLGNGSSMIIFASIVSRFPDYLIKTVAAVQAGGLSSIAAIFALVIFVAIAACIVFLEKGERKIPIQYTRRVIGQRMYGGQATYIPFKINPTGVMPAILTSSILYIPFFVSWSLSSKFVFFKKVAQVLQSRGLVYDVLQFVLIVFFTFFYTALLFNANDLADQLKKSGAFIPTIRPGKQTASYFDYILTRIAFIGAMYLGFITLVPNLVTPGLNLPFTLGGISILIAVGVALEFAAQVESYLIEHRYDGFLTSGRIKGRTLRR